MLVVSAHAADFVWRAGGAIALYAGRGHRVVVVCLSYGERGESARFWKQGLDLGQIKAARHEEAEKAAAVLGAELRCFDADDYPLLETPELVDRLVQLYREVQPTVVLTHTPVDPYNMDHGMANQLALKSRIIAQAPGYDPGHQVLGAPPVFLFEPHQTEMCEFRPDVLLDITEVWPAKRRAMEVMAAQEHLWEYYTDVAKRRGTQAGRNSKPNLGQQSTTMAEAFQRVYPQVASELS
jgi:4-oxalomesaconate hydratase